MTKNGSRTESSPRFKEVNDLAARRTHFHLRAAWEWLKKHEPDVAKAIFDEAYRRWPPPPRPGRVPFDLAFLDQETPQNARRTK